jgi:hypothetical protein
MYTFLIAYMQRLEIHWFTAWQMSDTDIRGEISDNESQLVDANGIRMRSVRGNEHTDVQNGRRTGARTKPVIVDATWTRIGTMCHVKRRQRRTRIVDCLMHWEQVKRSLSLLTHLGSLDNHDGSFFLVH